MNRVPENCGTLSAWQHTHNGNARRRQKRKWEKLSEKIKAKNFPNLGKNINLHIQEIQWTPSKINSKASTLIQIIVKCYKPEEKNLENTKKEGTHHIQNILNKIKGWPLIGASGQWDEIFKVLKEKYCQPRILYIAK